MRTIANIDLQTDRSTPPPPRTHTHMHACLGHTHATITHEVKAPKLASAGIAETALAANADADVTVVNKHEAAAELMVLASLVSSDRLCMVFVYNTKQRRWGFEL